MQVNFILQQYVGIGESSNSELTIMCVNVIGSVNHGKITANNVFMATSHTTKLIKKKIVH